VHAIEQRGSATASSLTRLIRGKRGIADRELASVID